MSECRNIKHLNTDMPKKGQAEGGGDLLLLKVGKDNQKPSTEK
jgi:hypothetical protein